MACPDDVMRWKSIAEAYCGEVDANMVLAVIWQESSGNEWAYRFEPGYQYFFDAKAQKALYRSQFNIATNRAEALRVLGTTEFYAQSASFGLMQVMGAVAREHGATGWLTRLCDPGFGIAMGCKYLNVLYKRNAGDKRMMLFRYNGGSAYPDEVFEKLKEIV